MMVRVIVKKPCLTSYNEGKAVADNSATHICPRGERPVYFCCMTELEWFKT